MIQNIQKVNVATVSLLIAAIVLGSLNAPQVAAAACAPVNVPSAHASSSALATSYTEWKAAYVTSNGAGGDLRVQRSDYDGYDTVSEGIAYGMLFAA
ncbi:MAG: hypothetical protein EOO17_05670 [Chloroflexi bacterium]|nr:MAG: hypothetical protein EOO17_05670 [Chloroflexota bacterium]